jgi:hypothetical protein
MDVRSRHCPRGLPGDTSARTRAAQQGIRSAGVRTTAAIPHRPPIQEQRLRPRRRWRILSVTAQAQHRQAGTSASGSGQEGAHPSAHQGSRPTQVRNNPRQPSGVDLKANLWHEIPRSFDARHLAPSPWRDVAPIILASDRRFALSWIETERFNPAIQPHSSDHDRSFSSPWSTDRRLSRRSPSCNSAQCCKCPSSTPARCASSPTWVRPAVCCRPTNSS